MFSIIVAFLALSGLVLYLSSQYPRFEMVPLLVGNGLLALVSILSFRIIYKGIKSGDANAFVRSKMTGTMLKFFICTATVLVYIFINERRLEKGSLFLFLGMYVVYAAIESVPLSKLAKDNPKV